LLIFLRQDSFFPPHAYFVSCSAQGTSPNATKIKILRNVTFSLCLLRWTKICGILSIVKHKGQTHKKMASRKNSQLQVRSQPTTRIHREDKNRVNELASELNVLNLEALRIVLMAGFEAIENRTADPQRIKEELAA
jgi:hypothetical protein